MLIRKTSRFLPREFHAEIGLRRLPHLWSHTCGLPWRCNSFALVTVFLCCAWCLRSDVVIVGHVSVTYLLTYLVTYLLTYSLTGCSHWHSLASVMGPGLRGGDQRAEKIFQGCLRIFTSGQGCFRAFLPSLSFLSPFPRSLPPPFPLSPASNWPLNPAKGLGGERC